MRKTIHFHMAEEDRLPTLQLPRGAGVMLINAAYHHFLRPLLNRRRRPGVVWPPRDSHGPVINHMPGTLRPPRHAHHPVALAFTPCPCPCPMPLPPLFLHLFLSALPPFSNPPFSACLPAPWSPPPLELHISFLSPLFSSSTAFPETLRIRETKRFFRVLQGANFSPSATPACSCHAPAKDPRILKRD